jgi:uncharacterized membrane protein YkvA (DUF1232 family)
MDNKNRSIIPSKGALGDIILRVKLIARLMGDSRVSPWLKLIPVGSLIYLISPIDLIMGIPGIDALDDAAILWLGATFFVEMCPTDVVREHLDSLVSNDAIVNDARKAGSSGEIIDAETKEIKD